MRNALVTGVWLSVAVAAGVAQTPQIDLEMIGPRVGSTAPEFAGVDQFGRTHTLASTLGTSGAMLVFFRSADW